MATGIAPSENGLYGGGRDVAIGRGQDGVVKEEVKGGVRDLGGIEAIRIRVLACVRIMVQGEDARAMG
jgi:hypothetical protein